MCSFKSIYFVIFILNLYKTNAQISDKRLCVDSKCKEPVSFAKTLLRYTSTHPQILSFAPNQEVKIFSKEAGSQTNLWGAEINGRRGYIPKTFVREYKLLKKPTFLVDTESIQKPQVPVDVNKENVQPDKVQESFEVVSGTTIYFTPQDGISPSSTESPVLSTAAPPSSGEVLVETEVLKSAQKSEEKEADGDIKDDTKESVVSNVLSSFSSWVGNGNSEEVNNEDEDDEEDEEDDEEESEEDEEDSIETNDVDINSIHNLPPELKVSLYNLEVEESILKQDNAGSKTEKEYKENISLQEEKNNVVEDLKTTSSETVIKEEIKETDLIGKEKSAEKPSESVNKELGEDKNKLQTQEDPIKPEETVVETVTEPTILEDEPLPILEDATPNPLKLNTVDEVKRVESSVPELNPPQQTETLEENMNQQTSSLNSAKIVNLPVDISNVSSSAVSDEIETANSSKENIESTPTISDNDKPVDGDKILNDSVPGTPQIPPNEEENPPSKESASLNGVYSDLSPLPFLGNVNQGQTTEDQNLYKEITTEQVKTTFEEKKEEILNIPIKENENSVLQEQKLPQEEKEDILNTSLEGNENTSSLEQKYSQEKTSVEDSSKELPSTDARTDSDISKKEIHDNYVENVTVEPVEEIEEDPSKEKVLNDELQSDQIQSQEVQNEYRNEESIDDNRHNIEDSNIIADSVSDENPGILAGILDFFKSDSNSNLDTQTAEELSQDILETQKFAESDINYCEANSESCNLSQNLVPEYENTVERSFLEEIQINFTSDIFLYLITTAISVILFMFGYLAFDRHKREAPLVARINKLEKELLVTLKENELLQEKGSSIVIEEVESVSNEVVEQLNKKLVEMQEFQQLLETKIVHLEKELEEKEGLEDQIESLEKELETSTEVGMELNRIISEMLDPMNGSEKLKENVEQLQRQLLEQKDTINTINENLKHKEVENKKLSVELGASKKQASDLQSKLNEMADRILKIEKERDQQQVSLQNEITIYRQKYSDAVSKENVLNNDVQVLRVQLATVQRETELKSKEYQSLKESLEKIKSIKNDSNALKSLLDASSTKAELQQLKSDSEKYAEQLQQEQLAKIAYEKKYLAIVEEVNLLKQNYDLADKKKVELNSKLEVLTNYFKKREAELQEEIIKYKSIWDVKEGEATSTTERIKYMQEEIENYKAQNETLKQEIISQEIELKSQISVLEKKVHENWVAARQTERKLEDARQEAAQLRNRLTLRERAINDHTRLQSPIEQNGELPLSPHPIDSPASPPLLYGVRDHITKSPPIPGLPHFLPPPPGAPFMPPPLHGMPPFMPPPPSMFPGDHRPPPLGRMSSPPLNSRYSPDTSAFSPYDRHSPSPPYDSEYGASPPPLRGYSPYRDDRRDYKRPPHVRTNGRNMKGSLMSSGSDHSNDSLDKVNRKQSKMV